MGQNNIGRNIKRLRIQHRMTQQRLADMCKLSKSMISKIESTKVMPAIATLSRIAQVFNVKISYILEEGHTREAMHQSTKIPLDCFIRTEIGYRIFSLAAEYGDKVIQPLIFYAHKDEVRPHLLSHNGEECIYVLRGEMIFQVGEKLYVLKEGDFLYFDSIQPHGIKEVEDSVHYLDLFSSGESDNSLNE